MSITNTWAVTQMDCYPEYEGQDDVVFTVHWTLAGDDGEGHTGHVYGSCGVSLVVTDGFTPFADLTEAEVMGWVHDAMGVDGVAAHEANVAQQIADQIDPPVIHPPLPWATA
jgi:hypothetical protein